MTPIDDHRIRTDEARARQTESSPNGAPPRTVTRDSIRAAHDAVPARTPASPFERVITTIDPTFLSDEILPPGTLLECVSVDVLNCYINYVDLSVVITERDPDEHERYISQSNQFYTHFHEFGTVIHVIASSARHWWYFCYDLDESDCTLGRVAKEKSTLAALRTWVVGSRVTQRYPTAEIDTRQLRGWRSFQ